MLNLMLVAGTIHHTRQTLHTKPRTHDTCLRSSKGTSTSTLVSELHLSSPHMVGGVVLPTICCRTLLPASRERILLRSPSRNVDDKAHHHHHHARVRQFRTQFLLMRTARVAMVGTDCSKAS